MVASLLSPKVSNIFRASILFIRFVWSSMITTILLFLLNLEHEWSVSFIFNFFIRSYGKSDNLSLIPIMIFVCICLQHCAHIFMSFTCKCFRYKLGLVYEIFYSQSCYVRPFRFSLISKLVTIPWQVNYFLVTYLFTTLFLYRYGILFVYNYYVQSGSLVFFLKFWHFDLCDTLHFLYGTKIISHF